MSLTRSFMLAVALPVLAAATLLAIPAGASSHHDSHGRDHHGPHAPEAHTVSGKVVDISATSITLNGDGRTHVFAIDANTTVSATGPAASSAPTLASITVGSKVRLTLAPPSPSTTTPPSTDSSTPTSSTSTSSTSTSSGATSFPLVTNIEILGLPGLGD